MPDFRWGMDQARNNAHLASIKRSGRQSRMDDAVGANERSEARPGATKASRTPCEFDDSSAGSDEPGVNPPPPPTQ